MKTALTTAPVLAFPDFDKEFILVTDASNYGIGACLMQQFEGKKMNVIAYHSRKLHSAEINYSVTDKESLAVVDSLRHFRYLIFGHSVTVYTDHQAVLGIFKNPHLSGRRARWFEIAYDYEVKIRYIAGRENQVADALSRNFADEKVLALNENRSKSLPMKLVKEHQGKDEKIRKIVRTLNSDNAPIQLEKDELGCPNDELKLRNQVLVRETKLTYKDLPQEQVSQVIIPKSLVENAIRIIHDDRAHPGRDESIRQARMKYYWKDMIKDISAYIIQCNVCAEHKGMSHVPVPMQLYPVPHRAFERVHIDLLTNLSETDAGNKHVLVCVDALTRYVELIPLENKTAEACAIAFHENFILRFGPPEILVSDNGLEFTNAIMKNLADRYHINHVHITPYRPQGNGLAERTIRKLLNVLMMSILEN